MAGKTTRFVAVLEGEGPGTSRPILATGDPECVEAVTRIIQARLGRSPSPVSPPSTKGEEVGS